MKPIPMTRILRRVGALVLAAVLAVPPVSAYAGEKKLQTAAEVTKGLTYFNTVTEKDGSRVESFALELEQRGNVRPILLQSSGTVYGTATVNKAIANAEALGYRVLGAVNTDYFSTSTGVPMGIVIEDGVYKSGAEGRPAVAFTGRRADLVESPVVTMTLTNRENDAEIAVPHFNKWRSPTGGLYLLNGDFSTVSTRTTTSGWYVRMQVVTRSGDIPKLNVNSRLTLEVTEVLRTDQAAVIGEGEYILTADDASRLDDIFAAFSVGDRVILETECENKILSAAHWAGGTGDVMILDGEMTDSAGWTHIKEGKAPRTAMGVKADGTLLLYAVDGRQSGYSTGLTQKDLAAELLEQGCEWAVNLDGGGSTTMSVHIPGTGAPAVQNTPSDGKVRSCATYLLLVTKEEGDGEPDRLAMAENGLVVLTGSSVALPETVVLDDGLNVLDEPLTDLTITSRNGLGDVAEGIYTAGTEPGTDTLRLRSRRLGVEGTVQIHVVDSLTGLTVTRADSGTPITNLTVKPGETVPLSVTGTYWEREALRPGTQSVSWSVTEGFGSVDENGLFTAGEAGGSGTVTAEVGGLTQTVTLSMTNVHTDVTEEHWAYQAVKYCYETGIVGGISTTQFGRDNQIRRGDFMLMLYNAVGRPQVTAECAFTDVSPEDYYYTALAWGQNAGLASGTGNGAYSPTASVTREQAFTILRQAMPLLGKECPTGSLKVLEQFSDRAQIADYAKGHTATLVAQGVVSGKGDGIDPKGNLTRAEMAALLYKLITYTPITEDIPAPTQPALTLDRTELTLPSAGSAALTAILDPAEEGAVITWSTSDPDAAVVTADGVVTNLLADGEGRTVTVTAAWGEQTAECSVYCEPAKLYGTVINAEKGLNVRSGPGTDSAVVGGVANEARVIVLSAENGWLHILYRGKAGQAAVGYVSGAYVQLSQ